MNSKVVLFLSVAVLIALLSAHSRPSRQDLSKVNFALECTTSSDPSNRLLFAHEEVVNSFLDVPRKFGPDRMVVMHLSNDHLATHGGTTKNPSQWCEGEQLYKLQNDWGMIGDITEDSPKVYFLHVSSLLGSKRPEFAGKSGVAKGKTLEQKPSERTVDAFEVYALSQLKKGEALVRWERNGSMRAVGAIRSTAACARCHETKDGELLGAFTYDFAKTTAPEMPNAQKQAFKYAQEGKTVAGITAALKGPQPAPVTKVFDSTTWQTRQWLLDAGVVTPDMVQMQAEQRKYLLEWVQSSFNRPEAQAKN